MKKSTKIILITSAVLIFGGVFIAAISGAAGGSEQFKGLVKRQMLRYELPWPDVTLQVSTDGIYFTNNDPDENVREYDEQTEEVDSSLDVDASEVKSIELELDAGNFEIKESKDGSFYYETDGVMRVTSSYRNGTLKVTGDLINKWTLFGSSNGNTVSVGSATIYLPNRIYEEINLDIGAGEFTGYIPECEALSVRLGAGECDFDSVKAKETEFQVGVGECHIGMLETDEMDADIEMGEISIGIVGEENDYDYDIEVGAGEVHIGTRTYSGIGSGGSRDNGSDRKIDVECGMGEVRLDFIPDENNL